MKILLVHSDFIEYESKKKAIEAAEAVEMDKKRVEDCLVVFCSAEEGDDDSVVSKVVAEIDKVAKQVSTKTVVVYPFVHLTSTPAKPAAALDLVKKIEDALKKDYETHRAPFGWYKAFNIKSKGHPLSELSREIRPTGEKIEMVAKKPVEEKYDPKQLLHQISKSKLDRAELKDNDHRIIGQSLDLFSFSELAPGMVFWHNNGLILYNELARFWSEEHRKAGYQEVSTPQIMDNKLWKISGHWEKYKENIFLTKYEDRDFAVKPMNCPGAMLIYRSGQRSYRDLPLRLGELGVVYRQELSGVLSGLFRVIKFTQDDAHIFCTEDQLEDEITDVMNMTIQFFKKLGLEFDHLELSTRPEKRIGSDAIWDKAEKILEKVLKENNVNYKINPGDGAFYGPKIDFHLKDSLNRTWQCSTIQLDFAMPERFELEYIGADGQNHRPVMLHNVIYGSLERFIGILLEHCKGALPVWLSPVQVRVLTLTDRNVEMANRINRTLIENGIRSELDTKNSTVDYKIRDAEMFKVPHILVIGDKEEQNNTLAVRSRGAKPQFGVNIEDFLAKIRKEIDNKQ